MSEVSRVEAKLIPSALDRSTGNEANGSTTVVRTLNAPVLMPTTPHDHTVLSTVFSLITSTRSWSSADDCGCSVGVFRLLFDREDPYL